MKHDVIIVGGSFAGLAVASQLHGKVLIVDRKPIGTGQRSACGTPLRVARALGLEKSVLQVHKKAVFHFGRHAIDQPIPEPYCTLDYEAFCQGLFARSGADFLQASVRGTGADAREGIAVFTTMGELRAQFVVDASGWAAVATRSLDSRLDVKNGLSFGLETTVPRRDEGLHFWLDRDLHAGKVGWLFPCGEYSRVGLASYPGNGVRGERVRCFALDFGPGARSLHGGYFPCRLRRPVVGPLFLVGDAAGQCLPLTAEGIRPAIFFGQRCGELLRAVLDGELTLGQAQRNYRTLVDGYRPYYRWMLLLQRWGSKLPSFALACLFRAARITGVSDRSLQQYCGLMPIARLHSARRADVALAA